jgi:hypothetical protein
MSTTLTATDAAIGLRRTPRARRRALPRGVPRWLWLLGVTVQPLGAPDPSGTQAWVVSAGAGTTGLAALFFATVEQGSADLSREDRS